MRYTAASSEVSKPTSRFGSFDGWSAFRASDRSVGPILAAQPQVRDRFISVFFLLKNGNLSSRWLGTILIDLQVKAFHCTDVG
jgi:hypothetical protein